MRFLDRYNRVVVALDTPKLGRSDAVTELASKLATLGDDHRAAKDRLRRALRDQARARAADSQKIAERRLAGKKGSDPLPTEPAAALVCDRAKLEVEGLAKAIDLCGDELARAIVTDREAWIERAQAAFEKAGREYQSGLATARRAAAELAEAGPAVMWLREFSIVEGVKVTGGHAALATGQFPGPDMPTVRPDFSVLGHRSDIPAADLLRALGTLKIGSPS